MGRKTNFFPVNMWRGYENALRHYLNTNIVIWTSRGYRNFMDFVEVTRPIELPPWLGDPNFHDSHKAALLAKLPTWYGQFGWTVEPRISYFKPHLYREYQ